jgi:hypothetical protein
VRLRWHGGTTSFIRRNRRTAANAMRANVRSAQVTLAPPLAPSARCASWKRWDQERLRQSTRPRKVNRRRLRAAAEADQTPNSVGTRSDRPVMRKTGMASSLSLSRRPPSVGSKGENGLGHVPVRLCESFWPSSIRLAQPTASPRGQRSPSAGMWESISRARSMLSAHRPSLAVKPATEHWTASEQAGPRG